MVVGPVYMVCIKLWNRQKRKMKRAHLLKGGECLMLSKHKGDCFGSNNFFKSYMKVIKKVTVRAAFIFI